MVSSSQPFFAEFGSVIYRMRWTILTIASVLALAYVMNFSGSRPSQWGTFLAGLGTIYAVLAPVRGLDRHCGDRLGYQRKRALSPSYRYLLPRICSMLV